MSATNRSDVRFADDAYETPPEVTRAILPHLQSWTDQPHKHWMDRRPLRNLPYHFSVLDPFAGKGAILTEIKGFLSQNQLSPLENIRGIEIEPRRSVACIDAGFQCRTENALLDASDWGKPDLILTNPPFKNALPGLQKALREVKPPGEVAFLLRLGFLESQGRASFHRDHPSDVYILERRPEFAASMKCKEEDCSWHVMVPILDYRAALSGSPEHPIICPECEGKISVTTTDATAYAWFVWGPGRGGRWQIITA